MAVLIDDVQFHVFLQKDRIGGLLDAMERRLTGGASLRHDRLAQMSLRQWVAAQLRDRKRAAAMFDDVGGAACLWLALRHYAGSDDIARGIDRHDEEGMVLTVSIGEAIDSAPGTAWCFMLGHDVLDGRDQLAGQRSDHLRIFGTDVDGDWRDPRYHPKT
jgi:hypothetical protein